MTTLSLTQQRSIWARRIGALAVSLLGVGVFLFALHASALAAPLPNPAPPALETPQDLPVIMLSGVLTTNQVWLSDTVYVLNNVTVPTTVTVDVGPGTIIKIFTATPLPASPDARAYFIVNGTLTLSTVSPAIVFTSFQDDTYGGDSNGDGANTQGTPGDYREIRITTSAHTFQNAIVRYGYYGLRVYNSGATTIGPLVNNVLFQNNIAGLTLWVASTGDITSTVQGNIFTANQFGLVTRTSYPVPVSATGAARPNLVDNLFQNHNELETLFSGPAFPIFLDSAAYPIYNNNTFLNNLHQAIALGGPVTQSGTWVHVPGPVVGGVLPYVILGDEFPTDGGGTVYDSDILYDGYDIRRYADFRIEPGVTVSILPGTVIKFYYDPNRPTRLRYLYVAGTLNLQSTSTADGDRIIFTSYRDDDYGGDTNGDLNSTSPTPNNWYAVTLANTTTTFDYAQVRYAHRGLQVATRSNVDIAPDIGHNTFDHNTFGLFFLTSYIGNITSPVHDNVFNTNASGLATAIYTTTSRISGLFYNEYYSGTARPVLSNNQFIDHALFPIHLLAAGFPVYTGATNTFSGNAHPAIGLGLETGNSAKNYFFGSGAWPLVSGLPDINANLPYVVYGDNVSIGALHCGTVNAAVACPPELAVVTVSPNTVFKFEATRELIVDAYGDLDLTSTSADDRIIFTSYKDDVVDDTNNDGGATLPAAGNWGSVTFKMWKFQLPIPKYFNYALVRYASAGVQVEYDGLTSQNFSPEIAHNLFQFNGTGNYLLIKGYGDINSSIYDNAYLTNTFGIGTGLLTAASNLGVSRPTVYSNTFQGQTKYPLLLGGTAFPVYSNTTNVFINNFYTAIALGGTFRCAGINCGGWDALYNGNTNVRLPYVVITDVVIGLTATVNVPAGTLIKFNTTGCTGTGQGARCGMTVDGELTVQGTASNPVIFTSFKDDSSGGDTNSDGAATLPSRTDWFALTLTSNGQDPASYAFQYAVIKYSQNGVRVRATTIGGNVFPTIANNTFIQNGIGLRFSIENNGDIYSPVNDNIFISNTIAVSVTKNTGQVGQVLATFSNNDFYGAVATGNGVSMTVGNNSIITATANYWGSASGPYQALVNPTGQGVTVFTNTANTILLSNWDTSPNQTGIAYSIQGRVAVTGETPTVPQPLAGVILLLSNGIFTTTNQTGNYNIAGLGNGAYSVTPLLGGYTFVPISLSVTLAGADGTASFKAVPTTGTTYPVTGTVRDANGQPVPNALVYAVGTGFAALTDINGNYYMPMLANTYNIVALKPGYFFVPYPRVITVSGPLSNINFVEGQLLFLPLVRK